MATPTTDELIPLFDTPGNNWNSRMPDVLQWLCDLRLADGEELLRHLAKLARRELASPEDAADAVQEFFSRKSADSGEVPVDKVLCAYDPDKAPMAGVSWDGRTPVPWVIGGFKLFLLSERRRAGRAAAKSSPLAAAGEVPAPSADDPLVTDETKQLLSAALDRLGADDKLVLSMHYCEGLSVSAIAGQLGVSDDAVKMRLTRARRRLREYLHPSLRPDDSPLKDENLAAGS